MGKVRMTRLMMAVVRPVTSGAGRTKFQAALLLLTRGYIVNHCVQTLSEVVLTEHTSYHTVYYLVSINFIFVVPCIVILG